MIAAIVLVTPSIDAALAGLALGFATTMTLDVSRWLTSMVRVTKTLTQT